MLGCLPAPLVPVGVPLVHSVGPLDRLDPIPLTLILPDFTLGLREGRLTPYPNGIKPLIVWT